jgi:hypothetical protein
MQFRQLRTQTAILEGETPREIRMRQRRGRGSCSRRSRSGPRPACGYCDVRGHGVASVNTGPKRGSLLLINWPPEVVAMPDKPTLEFDPYVSGGMLLTRQTFRKLFRSERKGGA